MSQYIQENERTKTTKVIFSVRSKTLDIKEWLPWKYNDTMCTACGKNDETMDQFMVCSAYENEPFEDWKQINGDNYEIIITIGKAVELRHIERKTKMVGQATEADSTAQGYSS